MISSSLIKRASVFLTGSVIAQGLAAVSGLLLARWLDVEDYALYVIVIMVMGAIGVLTKGGVHLSFTAIMGREWPNMSKISEAIGSLKIVRRLISIVMLPIILTLTIYMLYANGATATQMVIISIALIIYWWADMQTMVVDQVLFFAHETTKVQVLDTILALIRLGLIATAFIIGELNIITAVLIGVVIALFRVKPIVKWVNGHFKNKKHLENTAYTKEMKHSVKLQMPVEIYTVFQVQFLLLMLTFFATTTQIAEYGAITRLMALLVPVNAFVYAFCVPIFNKRKEGEGKVLLILLALTSIPSILLIAVAYSYPEALLWLIGENYTNLHQEILIATVVFAFVSLVGVFWNLVAHKGMHCWTWLQIPIGVVWGIIAIWSLDLSTTTSALILQGGFSVGMLVAGLMDYFSKNKSKNSS